MKFFWMILYASQPYLMLPGILGFFGKEGEQAAEEMATVMGVILIAILAIAGMGLFLNWVSLV